MHSIFCDSENRIKICINIKGVDYTCEYPVYQIFDTDPLVFDREPGLTDDEWKAKEESLYREYIKSDKVYIGDNTSDSQEYFIYVGYREMNGLAMSLSEEGKPFIQVVFEKKVPNIGLHFPFIRYSCDFYQDRVSANFLNVNTIAILEQNVIDDEVVYEKPFIASDNGYSLMFQPTNDSELHVIGINGDYEVQYKEYAAFSLADEDVSGKVTPLTFSVAVLASEEGAYQTFLGIYMRSQVHPDMVFFMGCIVFKTEVEQEDERFRTLLGNFGLPDPIRYSNIFADADNDEELADYRLVNEKSKELMMTYDKIFSYVGTYKALMGAVKFLGYSDIIFKEWYTLLDSNDNETDIAVQVVDMESGEFLQQKLAQYGVSIEDFKRYNKINKISMVYHLNELSDEYEEVEGRVSRYDASTGQIVTRGTHIIKTDIPLTRLL